MDNKIRIIFSLMASTIVIGASVFVPTAYAKGANYPHANDVAHNANTNEGHIKDCKETDSAKDCATGFGNNGDFTSRSAHDINKP